MHKLYTLETISRQKGVFIKILIIFRDVSPYNEKKGVFMSLQRHRRLCAWKIAALFSSSSVKRTTYHLPVSPVEVKADVGVDNGTDSVFVVFRARRLVLGRVHWDKLSGVSGFSGR